MATTESALARAEAAVQLGRLEHARQIIGEALVAAPHDPALLERMADLAYRLGRTDEALRMAGSALATDPDRYDAHLTAALSFETFGKHEQALSHARSAVALDPAQVPGLLTLAAVLSGMPGKSVATRAEARQALEQAIRLAPGHAGTHAYVAGVYRRLGDREAAGKHVDAGLVADPTNTDLLAQKAKLEISRRAAVRILRGLLGSRPEHTEARKLLAAITWRALLRLVVWLWFFAISFVIASMWLGPGVLRVLSLALFVIIPVAWTGVFRGLRKQLPPGYLRQRLLRRAGPMLALIGLVFATLIADLGTIVVRLDWTADSVRGGYILLVAGVVGAALAHMLFFGAWLRGKGGENDREASFDYAAGGVIVLSFAAPAVLGLLAVLRHWSRQPAAFWAAVAIASIIAVTLLIEMLTAVLLDRRPFRVGWVALAAVPILVLAICGIWWGANRIVTQTFHSEERLKVPTFPEMPPLPPVPTFHFTPPVLSPPPLPPEMPEGDGG
ncbi:tetratricopeptide repeat protein [Nocardia australiensis]|uniref:tetratricopeptide repeat protein n=1 Tax=Nocardia australiensis TaxID=2887191 RepID=UPI001D1537D3|nr:tetratricopeptide repeat protein [Nocardia australiensis]